MLGRCIVAYEPTRAAARRAKGALHAEPLHAVPALTVAYVNAVMAVLACADALQNGGQGGCGQCA
eukprot:11195246-Lingulodinium_polyedra.AAC.1